MHTFIFPTTAPADSSTWASLPAHWPVQGDLLSWCQDMNVGMAVLLIVAGIIFLLWGYEIAKVLVTVNAAVLGGYFGAVLGVQGDTAVAGSIVGALVAAAVTWPAMKYAVAVMGALFGVALGQTIWRLLNVDPNFAWAGGVIGLVACGLLSFLLFRACVMSYTSLQGSVMLVFGILGLLYKYESIAEDLTHHLSGRPMLLPMCIFIPAVLGVIFQQTRSTPPAHAASGGGGSSKK